jgi:hypothetical protein
MPLNVCELPLVLISSPESYNLTSPSDPFQLMVTFSRVDPEFELHRLIL